VKLKGMQESFVLNFIPWWDAEMTNP